MNSQKRHFVYNRTDGVFASPDAMTNDEAAAFVQAFRQRYTRQGYYLTARRERIRPEDVQLEIIGDDEPSR